MDVVQGFVLTAAAPCTGLCAGRRKSLNPFGRGVYAKRVLRVRPMHLPRVWLGLVMLAFAFHDTGVRWKLGGALDVTFLDSWRL